MDTRTEAHRDDLALVIHCRIWTHLSRVQIGRSYKYNDPFALSEKEIDRGDWIETLNELWDKGKLPREFIR